MTIGIIHSIKPIHLDHVCTVYPCFHLKSLDWLINKKLKRNTIALEEEIL